MTTRGVTKNIALAPRSYKDLDDTENFVPNHIDLRNGYMTDARNWHGRPGYKEAYDVGVDRPIDLLIPEDSFGYAVTDDGKVFKLKITGQTDLTGKRLDGTSRPQFSKHDTTITVVDGGNPIKIVGAVTSALGGSPSKFKYIGKLGPYTLGAGHNDTEAKFSASNNPENWTTGDSGNFNVKKDGVIKNFGIHDEKVHFFKDNNLEVWYNRGGATPFVRIGIINKGMIASYSLILESNAFYWLGDDRRFYRLDGATATPISSPFESYIQSIPDPTQIYGFNFREEHLLKWVSPLDGKVMVYDYKNGIWSEDNRWVSGQWQRIPMASYMEINNKRYIGSYNLDGKIHEWSKDYLDDDGQDIRVYRKFAVKPSTNGHKSRFNKVGFRMKRGVATATVTAPVMLWRHRVDKKPWSNEREIDMGILGDYDPYIQKRINEVGREIEFEVYSVAAVQRLLTHMDLTVRELNA